MKLLDIYRNGNYRVRIYDDGTKIRETLNPIDTEFIPEFPESIDLKITNKCDMNCKMCHENSSIDGLHGDINLEFIDSIHPYTEVAIGGGNPLAHPQLLNLLDKFYKNKVIANITVNQDHFLQYEPIIKTMLNRGLIHGFGVSYTHDDPIFIKKIIKFSKKYPNTVIHVIAGLIDVENLMPLYDNDLKLLILGYKDFRRGHELLNTGLYGCRIKSLKMDLGIFIYDIINHFEVVAFDNLAIEQLNVKSLMNDNSWNSFYQGDDGSHTFYIDLVNKQYAKNSISTCRYDLTNNVTEMFQRLRNIE